MQVCVLIPARSIRQQEPQWTYAIGEPREEWTTTAVLLQSPPILGAEQPPQPRPAGADLRDETAELRQWDISFWAERLREDKYAITDEELRGDRPVREGRGDGPTPPSAVPKDRMAWG